MAFAGTSVEITPAPAVQGDRVNNGSIFYTAHNFLSAGPVTVGNFVWRDSTYPEIAVAAAGSDDPLGIVERTHEYTGTPDSLVVPDKSNVTIIEKGAVWVPADTTVSVGDKAFAIEADGTIQFAASGSTVTGGVETAWTAFTSGTTGELIMISNVL